MSWSYPSGFDASTALTYAGYCQQTYLQYFSLQDPPTPPPFGYTPDVEWPPSGYQVLSNIYCSENILEYFAIETPLIGFVLQNTTNTGEVIFVLRGTETLDEWVDDLLYTSQGSCVVANSQGLTHQGFNTVYSSLSYGASASGTQQTLAQLVSTNSITSAAVTGHSLGGALATLLALDLTLNNSITPSPVYTFASPVVGDPTFAAFYDTTIPSNSFQVANGFDLVPNLPPSVFYYPSELSDVLGSAAGEYDYQQVGGYCPIDGGATPFEDAAHSLTAYVAGLNALLSTDAGAAARRVVARRRRRPRPVAAPELAHV